MIFFNSSLPRSGSTLMQNILGQNPAIHVTPTDGVLELLYGAKANYTSQAEFRAQDPDQMLAAWRGFCKGGLEGYCKGLSDKPNTCIKSRGIGANYEWFSAFMGEEPKVLIMVRDMKAIMSSMEKLHRKQAEQARGIDDPVNMRGLTVESRVQTWMSSAPVGLALQRLQDMKKRGVLAKCLVVRYEDLAKSPAGVMEPVYKYLGLPAHEHDFNQVAQLTQEDDAVFGMPQGLHLVREKIEPAALDYYDVLGRPACKWIDEACAGYQADFGY